MNLSNYLHPDLVFPRVEANDKDELLAFLLDEMEQADPFLSQTEDVQVLIRDAVLRREEYGSTALGHGLLFPHARVPGFNGLLLVFATLREPFAAPTPDGEPISLACLAIVPADRPAMALKVVSGLARVFANPEARAFLHAADDPKAVRDYLTQHDVPIETVIHVRDLVRPYTWTARLDTPMREVTRRILQNRMPAVAVLDDEDRLLGEITPTRLFRYGLPAFFHQLKSVSFIRDFDPFERYFLTEAQSVAEDCLNKDTARLTEDGTLMEVVHELGVKRRAAVHVIRDGKAIGFVDNAAVLNRVLSP